MPPDDRTSLRCELHTKADLLVALDECLIEHPVDDYRTFVLYCEAILDHRVTDGTLVTVRVFTVMTQGLARLAGDPNLNLNPYPNLNPELGAIIADFCTALVAATDTDRR